MDEKCDCGGTMQWEGMYDWRKPQEKLWRCSHCKEVKIEIGNRFDKEHI